MAKQEIGSDGMVKSIFTTAQVSIFNQDIILISLAEIHASY